MKEKNDEQQRDGHLLPAPGFLRERARSIRNICPSQFRHHNPYVPGDRASLLAAMEENAVTFPQKEFEAVRALEDGDLVAVHGRVRLTPSRPWIALIHIFRFQDNQIIEEWEVGQEVPQDSPNEHGVF